MKKSGFDRLITSILVIFILGSLVAAVIAYNRKIKIENLQSPQFLLNSEIDQAKSSEANNIQIFHTNAPLVVFVHNLKLHRNFFSWDIREVERGAGSGFIWDKMGHIVTNYHVVQNADRIAVTLSNGKTYSAKVVGAEPRKDIAILKVSAFDMEQTPFSQKVADSSKLLVGQKAIAIGNPYGLDNTLTVGVVSALGRSVPSIGGVTIRDMIQTDASINPGNSGGPLINSAGQLIGINTAIYSKSGSSAGIGFAVPSNTVKRIVGQILKYGRVVQPDLGITILEESISRRLGIKKGIVVRDTIKGTPAEQIGMRGTKMDQFGRIHIGDIITNVDGEEINNYDDLYNTLESRKVGDRVLVEIIRNRKTMKIELPLVDISD